MSSDGGGQGAGPRREDLRLEAEALRNDWPIPPEVRRRILQRCIDYLDREHLDGEAARPRTVLAAARVLAQFAGLSLQQAKLDLDRELAELKLGGGEGTLIELVADAEKRAAELDRQRGERPALPAPGELPG